MLEILKKTSVLIRLKEIKINAYFLVRWIIISGVTGIVCGLIGTGFFHSIRIATVTRSNYPWIIILLPVAGLVINFIYQSQHMEKGADTNLVIKSIREEGAIPFKLTYSIFIATFLTHFFGGSAGREGAALQIGGGIGATIGRVIKLNEQDQKLITMCGMSAVFSALFGTPITATVFSIEVITVGLFQYSALVPCMVAATIANQIAKFFNATEAPYKINEYPAIGVDSIIRIIIVGVLCALLSILFCRLMHVSSNRLAKYITNRYIRVFFGGVAIVILTLLIGNQDYNGAGGAIIERAVEGHVIWYAFLLKMIFTAITLGSGYKGGEIVPTLFIGATFGCLIGPYVGLPASFTAAVGMVATFCGVVNCPISSILLAIELFGSNDILLFAIACAISYLMSGYTGLYSGQKIAYSKVEPKFINTHAR